MSAAKIYGESFFELARSEGLEDIILSDLRDIAGLFKEHPQYVTILDSPQIERGELMTVLNEDFSGRVNRYTLNFLKLLCEKHMAHFLAESLAAYEDLYNRYKNIKTVSVTTARPLSEETAQKLTERLEAKTGCKIILKRSVDETCIGGIIIETDGKLIDSSIKSELSNLKRELIL